jgi:hypothetical protein
MRASASSDLELTWAQSYWTIVKCVRMQVVATAGLSLRFLFHHFSDTHRIWQAKQLECSQTSISSLSRCQ